MTTDRRRLLLTVALLLMAAPLFLLAQAGRELTKQILESSSQTFNISGTFDFNTGTWRGRRGTCPPAASACDNALEVGQVYTCTDVLGDLYVCPSVAGWVKATGGGGSTAFSAITGGTNLSAAMLVGPGASLIFTSSGVIRANEVSCTSCVNSSDINKTTTEDPGDLTSLNLGHLVFGTPTSGQQITYNSTLDRSEWSSVTGASAFGTIDTPTGTDPVADQANDTLIFASNDSFLTIPGDASNDSVTFTIGTLSVAKGGTGATTASGAVANLGITGTSLNVTQNLSVSAVAVAADQCSHMRFAVPYQAQGLTTARIEITTAGTAGAVWGMAVFTLSGGTRIVACTGNNAETTGQKSCTFGATTIEPAQYIALVCSDVSSVTYRGEPGGISEKGRTNNSFTCTDCATTMPSSITPFTGTGVSTIPHLNFD